MFGRLVALVRSDIDRQTAWLKAELGRQSRYVGLTMVLAAAAALCALGAIVVGCVALHWWLAMRYGRNVAFAALGGGFALLALMLFVLAFARHRPKLQHPPALQSVRPATLVNTVRQAGYGDAIRAGEQVSKIANDHLRHGSRQSLFGSMAVAALVGLIVGRRL